MTSKLLLTISIIADGKLAELQSAPPPETMREGLTRKVQIAKYEQEIADLEKKISLLRGN